jgi:hypothetical protein
MTIPWLQNCNHKPDGWCLACAAKIGEDHARALAALVEAEKALSDYIPQLERRGAALNYGRKVLHQVRAALNKSTRG